MKVVAQNKRAKFDYEILETTEAGIILTGPEVKSCRQGHVNLAGAYVSFLQDRAYVKHMKISPYTFAAKQSEYEPERDRELLLKNSERSKLQAMTAEKGIAVVPLEVRAGKYVKVLLGIGRGRKRIDKRQRIKEREVERKLKKGQEI